MELYDYGTKELAGKGYRAAAIPLTERSAAALSGPKKAQAGLPPLQEKILTKETPQDGLTVKTSLSLPAVALFESMSNK
jgi:hypothetical protein